jgi:epoxyqueuosine reductase
MKRAFKSRQISTQIIRHARRCGADLAGVAEIKRLAQSPSYRFTGNLAPGRKNASMVVLAVIHPVEAAWMDWWDGQKGGTPGNRKLITAGNRLQRWLRREQGIMARVLPYQLNSGGIFLKDAAVLAGLGTIGRNNLLITPRYGPRVRLRGLLVEARLRATGPLQFEPCNECAAPCREACPEDAFGRGRYERADCECRMAADLAARLPAFLPATPAPIEVVRFCRACELACPIGRD